MKNCRHFLVALLALLLLLTPLSVGAASYSVTGVNVNSNSIWKVTQQSDGSISAGLYFQTDSMDATYNSDWSLEYKPAAAENYQLIRDGVVYNVGNTGAGTIVRYSPTQHYLKADDWMDNWTNMDIFPFQAGDIVVIQGDYIYGDNVDTITFSKTAFVLLEDEDSNRNTVCCTVDAGRLAIHSSGWNSTTVYTNTTATALATGEYKPLTPAAVQISIAGQDTVLSVGYGDYVKLNKTGTSEVQLQVDTAGISALLGETVALAQGQIVHINGVFQHTDGSYAFFGESYIALETETGIVCYDTDPTEAKWIYGDSLSFNMDPNGAPYTVSTSLRYTPTSEENIKLVRNGVTYNIANTGAETITKTSATGYALETWMWNDYLPFTDGDLLIIDGKFVNSQNDSTNAAIDIKTSYIKYVGEELVFYQLEANDFGVHSRAKTDNGFYFTLPENDLAYVTDWNTRFSPTTADAIQVVRDGVSHSVGRSTTQPLVMFGATDYYFETTSWVLGEDFVPLQPGDKVILNGYFVSNQEQVSTLTGEMVTIHLDNVVIAIEESKVYFNPIEAGYMFSHSAVEDDNNIYFTMNSNGVPYTTDWSTKYNPTSAANIKLVKDGVVTNIGHTARESITKYSDTDYCIGKWILESNYQVGDTLIIEGCFTNVSTGDTMYIEKSYLYYRAEGDIQVYQIEAGYMQNHGNTVNNYRYYSMDANNAPYNSDWTLRYIATTADAIKRVTGTTVSDCASTTAETLVKMGDGYYFFETNCLINGGPTEDEILIIDGFFRHKASGIVMKVDKTYLYHNGTRWNYVTECPHRYAETVTDATCTVDGNTHYECVICGHSYDEAIAATGHSYSAVVTAPTCTEQGYTTHTCGNCGDTYVDTYVAATGHTEVTDAAVSPTCTATGLTEGSHCSVCNTVLVAQEVVPATGHSYDAVVTAPTPDAQGYTTHTCSACGDTYVDTYTDALTLKFCGAYVSLDERLSVFFKVKAEVFGEGGYTNPRAEFTYGLRDGDNKIVVETADVIVQDGYYIFECYGISPSQIGDDITAVLYGTYNGEERSSSHKIDENGEVVDDPLIYSVERYCYNMLGKTSDPKLQTLLVDLLNYGTASRIYSKYEPLDAENNVKAMPNAALTDEQKAYASTYAPGENIPGMVFSANEGTTVTWKSVGLVLWDTVGIRVRFELPEGTDASTLTLKINLDGQNYEISGENFKQASNSETVYYATFYGIQANQMREDVTFTVYNGQQAVSDTMTYGVVRYVAAMQNYSDQNLVDLIKALLCYGDSATIYASNYVEG